MSGGVLVRYSMYTVRELNGDQCVKCEWNPLHVLLSEAVLCTLQRIVGPQPVRRKYNCYQIWREDEASINTP